MDILKIAAGFVLSFAILLCSLILFAENPEIRLYEKTVESLMIREGMSSFQEVEDSFPSLQEVSLKIERIAYLKSYIQNITGGPAPNVSRERSLQVQDYTDEISRLRRDIEHDLSQLLVTYADVNAGY